MMIVPSASCLNFNAFLRLSKSTNEITKKKSDFVLCETLQGQLNSRVSSAKNLK